MRKERVFTLIPQVAQLTKFSTDTVQTVLQAHYDALQEFLNSPTHAVMSYDYFGKFISKPNQAATRVKDAIADYRRDPTEKRKEKISKFYKLYRTAKEYEKSTKYKTRFGSWHYTKKDGKTTIENGE